MFIERRRAVRPSLAKAISSRVSSNAVEVRTAMICSGGMEEGEHGCGREREA